MNKQKLAFEAYEGDNWFHRNFDSLDNFQVEKDPIISLIESFKIPFKSVLEIGSSFGYRLNGLKERSLVNCYFAGIDPSRDAISYGKKKFKKLDLRIGTADNLSEFKSDSFDLIIVGFVFYVVDRAIYLKAVSEIDRILKNKGCLIILDFFSEKPIRNPYKHISELEAYAFKQKYYQTFTSTNLYQLISLQTFDHESNERSWNRNYKDKLSLSLLMKDYEGGYNQ
jgi:ubiquinone/menaquinone biosynthesis C-methylase UbiE